MSSGPNTITHRFSSKPSPIESMTSKNSAKPRSRSPFNADQKPTSMAKKPLRRESTAISTLHPDTLYDNKHKERRSTMMNSSTMHNENHPNVSKNNEGKNSKTDKLQKFAKFNNSKLFKDKVVAAEPVPNRITPFRMDASGKDSAFSNQELRDSVLAKPFPFLGKGNQENLTPRGQFQDPLNYSSIELVTSQIQVQTVRRTSDVNAMNFGNLEPMNLLKPSLDNSMMTSGRKSLRLGCPDSISKSPYEPKFETRTDEGNTLLPPPIMETLHEDLMMKPNLPATEEIATENYYAAPSQGKRERKPIGLTLVLSILLVVLISALTFSYQQKNSFSPVQNLLTKIQTSFAPETPSVQQFVINDEKLLTKEKYLNFLTQVLSQTKGEHRCDSSVEYSFSLHQLGRMLQNRFGNEELYYDAAAMVEEELTNPTKDISVYGIAFNMENSQYSGLNSTYSLTCQAKTFLYEKSIHLVFLGLLGYTLFKYYQHKQKDKNFNRLVQRVYSEIMIELTQARKRCVKDLYDKVANKYGDDFAETVWPHVEQLRLKYGRILIFKDEYNGAYEYFWGI